MMDFATPIALGLGFFTGIIHFFSENLNIPEGPKRFRLISFAAGISIAYLFLDLLPHTYEAATHLRSWVFIFLLLGFASLHLAEKYIYQHADQEKLAQELKEVHSISFFCYYFIVGIVLKNLVQMSILEGTLFMIPIALHAALSTASLGQIHGDIRESFFAKTALSFSTLLGVVFATLIFIPKIVDNILVSMIAGILLYILVKEFLPEKKKGQPLFFVLGLALFVIISLILNLIKE